MFHQIPAWDFNISPNTNSLEEFLLYNVHIVHSLMINPSLGIQQEIHPYEFVLMVLNQYFIGNDDASH